MESIHQYLVVIFSICLLLVPTGCALRPDSLIPQKTQLLNNHPPEKPTIVGPYFAAPLLDITFTINATDPDGDKVYFKVDWGEGNTTDWLGPMNSTEPLIITYAWWLDGNYTVQVKVKDANGLESNDTVLFNITIAAQIGVLNLQSGYVYLGETYFYVGLLDLIGATVVFTTNPNILVNLSASSHVASIVGSVTLLKTGSVANVTDDNASDGFYFQFPVSRGLYRVLFLAYDADGNLIDGYLFNFILYIPMKTTQAMHSCLQGLHPLLLKQNL